MKLDSFTTCTDGDGDVTGIQFLFSLNPYDKENEDDFIEMSSIGKMTGTCKTLNLTGGLDRIRASSKSDSSGVNNIKYYRGSKVKSFGDSDADEYTEWQFNEDNELVGVYGRQSERGIEQLGFITLDTACQAAAEFKPEPEEQVVPSNVEIFLPEEIEQKPITEKESESGLLLGFDLMTIIITSIGLLVFIALLVISICACKAKGKMNSQNKIVMLTTPPVTTPTKNRKKAVKELQPVATPADIENYGTAAAFSDHEKKRNVFDSNKVAAYPQLETPKLIGKNEEIGI